MSCDAIRAAMQAAGDGEWPPAVAAHLATCHACVDVAIDLALRQRPASVSPPSFAADVARRARLEPTARRGQSHGLGLGVASGIVAAAAPAAWVASSGAVPPGLPIAVLLLILGECIALFALTLQTEVVRTR